MEPLVTLDQLADRLQYEPEPGTGLLAILAASGMVRAISGQTISWVPQDTIVLPGGDRVLSLPQRPVVVDADNPLTVVELGDWGSIDVTLIEDRDYTRIGAELTRGHPAPWTSRLMGWPEQYPRGTWTPRVRVTYSHGYKVIPDEIAAVVLDLAAAGIANPSGLRSWQTPEYSETYASEVLGAATVEGIKARLAAIGHGRRAAHTITPA